MRSEFADTGWMISNVSGRSLKIFVDGVEVSLNTGTNLGDGNTHIVEYVFKLHWVRNDSPSFNGVFANTEYYPEGSSPVMVEISKIWATGRRFYVWLPKLEDATDLPESEQRATQWIKHVDDAE
jgi:hypothetical protein